MKKDEVKKEIISVLDTIADCFATKNAEKYLNLYEDHPELVIYGSQSGEKWTSLDEYKKSVIENWELIENVKVVYDWKRIDFNPQGDIAWFATDLTFFTAVKDQTMNIPGRLTGILIKKNNKWKFVQTHYSMEHH